MIGGALPPVSKKVQNKPGEERKWSIRQGYNLRTLLTNGT
jgi:hypothetical protein